VRGENQVAMEESNVVMKESKVAIEEGKVVIEMPSSSVRFLRKILL
jgi:hypothetical protein